VTADADPGALARVIERFQHLNLVPRRVLARWATTDTLHIEVEIADLSEERLAIITAKLNESPSIHNACWHR
jgi:hypothetical protein